MKQLSFLPSLLFYISSRVFLSSQPEICLTSKEKLNLTEKTQGKIKGI